MHFRSNTFHFQANPFAEVFTDRDKRFFVLAYCASPSNAETNRTKKDLARTREWIGDVFHALADKLNLSFSQAKQLVEIGDPTAIYAIAKRRKEKLVIKRQEVQRADMHPGQKELELSNLDKQIAWCDKTLEMQREDVTDWIRSAFADCLLIAPPNKEHHEVSGAHHYRVGATQDKVGAPKKGNHTNPPGLTVEKRRPKAKLSAKDRKVASAKKVNEPQLPASMVGSNG